MEEHKGEILNFFIFISTRILSFGIFYLEQPITYNIYMWYNQFPMPTYIIILTLQRKDDATNICMQAIELKPVQKYFTQSKIISYKIYKVF